jgi:DNA-binding XRE family transcriptional regulator
LLTLTIIHNSIHALPFCYLTLRARKPFNKAYPGDLTTLGDHIRKRRLNLGMHQKDAARLVNAATSTVTNWEKNRTRPTLVFMPKIFEFLGYDPLQGNTTNQTIQGWEGSTLEKARPGIGC